MPSAEVVGKILGYPAAELVIEDVTLQERTIIQTPSRLEKRKQTVLPDAAVLLKAYLIHGKNENTFIPIQVYIGAKDSFLTSEVLAQADKIRSSARTRNPSWMVDFESLGRGGVYFVQDHKVKSEVPQLKRPSLVAAEVFVMQPHGHNFDVKIVQRAGLPQGVDLKPISGGEAYYNIFVPAEEQKAELPLDGTRIFFDLTKIVIAEWQAEQSANGAAPPTQPSSTQQTSPTKPPVVAPQTEHTSSPSSSAWWWLAGLALVVLAFIANAFRKCRS